jgi:hypothetical protein
MLEQNGKAATQTKENKKISERVASALPVVNFSLPFRPFIARYVRPSMSGREKFTLVVAFLTKGSVDKEVTLEDVKKQWRTMVSRLKKFNLAHSNRAKDRGWVDSPKRGAYVLLAQWQEIFRGN